MKKLPDISGRIDRVIRRERIFEALGLPRGAMPIAGVVVVEWAASSDDDTTGLVALLRAARLEADDEHGLYCPSCGHGIADALEPGEHDETCVNR